MSESKPTVLITGSARGIGLALVEAYADRGWHVIATCRSAQSADDLQALSHRYPDVDLRVLDVTDEDAVSRLAEKLSKVRIDVLLNNAGYLGPPEQQSSQCVNYDVFREVMKTNTYAPLALALAFMDHVAHSDQKKIVTLTSGLSSIANTNQFGNLYFYRASKAGLNVAMRALQADMRDRGVICAVVAPGIVDTGLLAESGYQGDALDASTSAQAVLKLIDELEENTGEGFPLYDGSKLPW
jgi:NAD(P)-dependent dehydrogenase (short-subunit alcohol dehydrogenase family)